MCMYQYKELSKHVHVLNEKKCWNWWKRQVWNQKRESTQWGNAAIDRKHFTNLNWKHRWSMKDPSVTRQGDFRCFNFLSHEILNHTVYTLNISDAFFNMLKIFCLMPGCFIFQNKYLVSAHSLCLKDLNNLFIHSCA